MLDFNHDRLEKRSVAFSDVELSSDGTKFEGYAAIYGQEADLGDFTEEVARGAFRKPLAGNPNVPMFWDHNDKYPPLATTGGGTLKLAEDVRGLHVQAELDPDHLLYPTLRSMIRRGDVTGMSFGFVAGPGNSRVENRGGRPHRVITNFKHILDVSPTWVPAYAGTSAELRSQLASLRMAEELDQSQQVLSGAYQQLGDGAPVEQADTGEETEAEVTAPVEQQDEEEQRSGVADEAAARRRRLQMMGLTLPKGVAE